MSDKTVGTLNGLLLIWSPGDKYPHVDSPDGRRYLSGIPLTYPEAFTGIPEISGPEVVGALAHWGAVFYLKSDGSWQANSTCGTWQLSEAA